MLLKELANLKEAPPTFKMDDEVKIVAGSSKGKEGYINRIFKSGGVVSEYEISIDAGDDYVKVSPSDIKKI